MDALKVSFNVLSSCQQIKTVSQAELLEITLGHIFWSKLTMSSLGLQWKEIQVCVDAKIIRFPFVIFLRRK